MKQQRKPERYQMSESFLVGGLLAVVGGYLDAYTYLCRGEVFANAQTGNIVFLGFSIVEQNWIAVLHYVSMIGAFILGVIVSDMVEHMLKSSSLIHWRQIVVFLEACLLAAVAFLPSGEMDLLVNAMISFVCAMQVECFRKIRGIAAATTMCTGNLRSGTEQLYGYFKTREKRALRKCLKYYGVIFLFVVGVVLGSALTNWCGEMSSLFSCGLLAIVFGLLFVKDRRIP